MRYSRFCRISTKYQKSSGGEDEEDVADLRVT